MALPNITNRQKDILLHLYRFRFLNRKHIQALLNQKDYKNTNLWLKDLTEKNYTGKIFERKPGITEPAIYYLSKNGIKFLHSVEGIEGKNLKKLRQEKRKSQAFIQYSLSIAQAYLQLQETYTDGFKFYTQSDFPTNGVIKDLSPSFAYVYSEGDILHQVTCEIFKENTPRFAIRARIQQYIEFFEDKPDMKIHFFTSSEKLLSYITRYSQRSLSENDSELAIESFLIS